MFMKEKLISIIVPVYNVEEYLERCINSILNQTYKNWEVIFINDGSIDRSLEILKEYKEKDKRIKIIDKKNAGSGAARNEGIASSRGEYIAFLDSDDWYEKNFLEKLYNNLIENNSDVVMCNPRIRYKDEHIIENINLNIFTRINLLQNPEEILKILEMPVIWNKIYKKDVIMKKNIKFPNCSFAEDVEFLYKVFLNVEKVSKIEEHLYNYYKGDNSLTKKVNKNKELLFKMYIVLDNIEKYVRKNYMEKIEFFYQYKLQFLFSITRNFKDKDLNFKNKQIIKPLSKITLLRNKKTLVYYIGLKYGICFEIGKILEILGKIKKGKK